MNTFNMYDLKEGNKQVWKKIDAVEEQEIEEMEEDESGFITALKLCISTVVSLVAYWMLCALLYNIRGELVIGGEVLASPILWVMVHKILDYLF